MLALAYTGHLLKAGERDEATLLAAERLIRARVDAVLDRQGVASLHGALACGSDILVAESGLARGIPLHLVLPFEADRFVPLSVAIGGPGWNARFSACLAAAAAVEILDAAPASDEARDALFHQALRHAGGRAIERAAASGGEAALLAVQDPGHHGGFAGSSRGARDWAASGRRLVTVEFPYPRAPAGDGAGGEDGRLAAFLLGPGSLPRRFGEPAGVLRHLAASPGGGLVCDYGLADPGSAERRARDAVAPSGEAAPPRLTAGFAMEAVYRGLPPERLLPASTARPPALYRLSDR